MNWPKRGGLVGTEFFGHHSLWATCKGTANVLALALPFIEIGSTPLVSETVC